MAHRTIWILAAFMMMLTTPAWSSPECLNKSEARAKWPTRHIFWHSGMHCWDSSPGGRRYHVLARQTLAKEPEPEPPRKYLYPQDPNGNMDRIFEDYCCWPDISAIKNLANGVEK